MQYKRFVISLITFLVILCPLFVLIAKKYDSSSTILIKEKSGWILNKTGGMYDIAFLGSSRVHNIVATKTVDTLLGVNSINLGVGGAAYPENYLLLEQFLRRNKIKTLCLQVDMWGLIYGEQAYSHSFSEEKYLHLLGDRVVDSVYSKNTNPLKFYFRKYVPFFKYSEYNSIYSVEKMLFGIIPDNRNTFDKYKGAELLEGRKEGIVFGRTDVTKLKKMEYSSNSTMSLRNIIGLAKSKSINVVLFTTPIFTSFKQYLLFDKTARDTIHKIAMEYKLPYFNFDDEKISSDSLLFRDPTHLNYNGGILFTINFCDTLKKYNYGKN